MLAKKELSGLLVLLCLDVVNSVVHFVLFIDHFVPVRTSLVGSYRVHLIRVHQVLLVHQKIEELFLQIVVLGPQLFLYNVLKVHFYLSLFGHHGMFIVVDHILFGLEAFNVSVGQFGHYIFLYFVYFLNLHSFKLSS